MARTSAPELTPCSSMQGSHSMTIVSSFTWTARSKREPSVSSATEKARATVLVKTAVWSCPRIR